MVGFTRIGDRDWFLIKDSNRSSRLGEHEETLTNARAQIQMAFVQIRGMKDAE